MTSRGYEHIDRALATLDKSSITSVFKEDRYSSFLIKKGERITAAMYILTSYFPDSEPLKWELRRSATELIKDTLSLNEMTAVVAREFFREPIATVARILSLLSLAHVADLVSPMNFSLFKKELSDLLLLFEDRGNLSNQQTPAALFNEDFFRAEMDEPELVRHAVKRSTPRLSRKVRLAGKREEQSTVHTPTVPEMAPIVTTPIKDTDKGHDVLERRVLYSGAQITAQGQTQVRGEKRRRSKGHVAKLVSDKVRAERQQIIVEMLKKKGFAMIKDFSSLIEGCSEKTIQRQLQDLVQSGVLKKEGVRRWSRYSLVGSPSELNR